MPKDQLARGARSASYGTSGKVGDEITLRNVSEEGRDTSLDGIVLGPVALKERRVRPINKQVLVERIPLEETTAGGLVIADGDKDRPAEGTVLAISDKVTQVKKGDTILFGKYSGQEVKVGGTKDNLPLLMEEDEILAVLED